MFIVFYTLSLALSSGLVGLFARQAVASLGFTGDFRAALYLTCGAAAAYAALQLLYVAFVRLVEPTRAGSHLFAESLSHLSALILIPYLLQLKIHWPVPALAPYEPLIFLGAFAAVHFFLKLMSFYAAIRGAPAPRMGAFGWLAASLALGLVGYDATVRWAAKTAQARPVVPEAVQSYRIGDTYASGRVFPEGAIVSYDLEAYDNARVSFYWANVPSAPDDAVPSADTIFATVTSVGDQTIRQSWSVSLADTGWSEMVIPSSALPKNVKKCSISWDAEKRPLWQRISGLRPLAASGRSLLISGPYEHETAVPTGAPSFVILVVDGLGANAVSGAGSKHPTTPSLDRFAQGALYFPNAYTPAPDSAAACMTLLTGVSPLRHGYMEERRGPLPRGVETLAQRLGKQHYCTASFTEGDAAKDLVAGSGFASGFELFDSSWHQNGEPTEVLGSKRTLQEAKAWIDDHAAEKFMLFVRIQELTNAKWRAKTAESAATDNPGADTALANIDREIGAFIKGVRQTPAGRNTCIIVTSSYGLDPATADNPAPEPGLAEDALRVPLMVYAPNLDKPARRMGLVALEDVAPTVLRLAQSGVEYRGDGKDLIQDPRDRAPISMFGDPLILSLRTDHWRFSWQSDACPFGPKMVAVPRVIEFYDVVQARKTRYKRNVTALHRDLAARYESRLENYLREQTPVSVR